jgi:hypothetical protein
MNTRRLTAVLAAAAVLVTGVTLTARAIGFSQQVLVYCPPSDTAGCETIAAALGNATKAYNGTNGTVDLGSADLSGYAVLVIPSLADYDGATPYALLRDPAVASHLRKSVLGRRAFWSGAPDQGTTNREAKNALLSRLASWAGANHVDVGAPGLLVLQDASSSGHYSWVAGITGINVIADPAIRSYSSVRAVTATGTAIVDNAAYTNMAFRGFYLPQGAAGISLDAVGNTGTSVGGQIVLMTHPGATEHQAVVSTDRDDYEPGAIVTITGSGFLAGESVELSLEEDPARHEERTFTVLADSTGAFVFDQFAPEEHDLDVRFILTATGQTSGRSAETTFTDAITRTASGSIGFASGAVSNLPVPAPAVAIGDVLIAQLTITEAIATSTVICAPAGWNSVSSVIDTQNKVRQAIFYRVAAAATADTIHHQFTFRTTTCGGAAVTEGALGHIVRYSGVDNITPIDAFASTAGTGSVASFVSPTVTTTVADARVIRFVSVFKDANFSTGTNRIYQGRASSSERAAGAWETTQALPGATGTHTASFTSSGEYVTQTVALRPAVVAAGPTKLAYTTSGYTGTILSCLGPISFQTQSATDIATSVTSNTTVSLATNGTGTFYSDNACTSSITSVVVNSGSNSGTFYYKGTVRGTGSHQLDIAASGLSGASQTQTINKADQTITFGSLADKIVTDADFTVGATASSGLTVSFASQTPSTCSVVSGTTVSIDAVGLCTIRASQAGNGDYNAATNVDNSFNISAATPTFTFDLSTLPAKTFGNADFSVASYASTNSTGAITFALGTGSTGCTVTSVGLVSIAGAATGSNYCIIEASLAADGTYAAAGPESEQFNIAKGSPTFTFNLSTLGAKTYGDGDFSVASYATTNSTGAITFALGSGSVGCTVSSVGLVSITAPATGSNYCIIEASLAADANYNAAGPESEQFNIAKATPNFTFDLALLPAKTFGDAQFSVATYAGSTNSTGAITFALGSGSTGCTVTSAGMVTITGAATGSNYCKIAASLAADANYIAAGPDTEQFNIAQATPTFSFDLSGLPAKKFGDAPFSVASYASSNTGATISFALGSGSVGCTVSGIGQVTITGAAVGTDQCLIEATLAATANYLGAGPLSEGFNIAKASTSLLYTGTQIVNTPANFTLSATLSSAVAACKNTQPIRFRLVNEGGTTVLDEIINTTSTGIASATRSSAGLDGVYEVLVNYAGSADCLESSDDATLLAATPGQSANGGGWYTNPGAGRINFGFNVRLVSGTGKNNIPAQYRGQLLLINNSKWRCKGTLSSFSISTTTNSGGSSGTCDLQWWDLTANSGLGAWVVAQSQVPLSIIFKAGNGGKGKTATVASFGAQITHTPTGSQPSAMPNSGLIELKGGNIQMQ